MFAPIDALKQIQEDSEADSARQRLSFDQGLDRVFESDVCKASAHSVQKLALASGWHKARCESIPMTSNPNM